MENTKNENTNIPMNLKPLKIETLNKTSLKSSQEKNLRKQIIDNMPAIADLLDKIWPKKASILVGKQKPYTTIYFVNDEPCFVEVKDEKIAPHLKLLHKCK